MRGRSSMCCRYREMGSEGAGLPGKTRQRGGFEAEEALAWRATQCLSRRGTRSHETLMGGWRSRLYVPS